MLLGYARVSTDDQTLDLQIDALTKAGVDPKRIYKEKASGANTKRPAYETLLRHVRPGDTIVVWRLDRFGRDLGEVVVTAQSLREKGVEIKSLTEPFDQNTAVGELMFNIIASFASFERRLIQERTIAGLNAARARGSQVGRKSGITAEVRARAKELVKSGAANSAKELQALLGIKKPTFHANFKGGFAALVAEVEAEKLAEMAE